jgi:hypothetical protein
MSKKNTIKKKELINLLNKSQGINSSYEDMIKSQSILSKFIKNKIINEQKKKGKKKINIPKFLYDGIKNMENEEKILLDIIKERNSIRKKMK